MRFSTRTSLTINKYLEEFPGLVHFIYIDRNTHRLVAPTLDFTSTETLALTMKKIWNMVEQSRMHLQEGHLSVMWKDTTFNYSYFLWFEDNSVCAVFLYF
ncbi:PREDICTED: Hermansky-Pudlak syndrome 1 protein homolog [Trachymyrmex septentrionalis]|uniref:Hermansky-Pudlak syndrome 1 protein homolog n=1 Tax=Trachymyrmex septentrionalis TaxID=34720 RepID=UPI00084F5E2E|nr:PREDICTED: Hermansky-Pudlak syndrome 1 protein homolog [Trachymyrmex septentrionalis]